MENATQRWTLSGPFFPLPLPLLPKLMKMKMKTNISESKISYSKICSGCENLCSYQTLITNINIRFDFKTCNQLLDNILLQCNGFTKKNK